MIFQEADDYLIVIDGQQRLATITILLAAIRDKLYEIGESKSALTINQNYILKELEKETQVKKLTLNLRNKDFFFDCIQLPFDDSKHKDFSSYKKLEKTNKLIKKAYSIFKGKIEEQTKGKNKTTISEYLNNLSASIRKTIRVMTMTVDTEEEAYLIFETINYRGLELSVADLFKNYLIRKAPQEDRDDIVRLWKDIATLLDENIRVFLRHYWLSKEEQVTERKLFGKLKKYIECEREKINVKAFVKELKEEAIAYAALQSSEDKRWKDKETEQLVYSFNTLKVKQCLPLLMGGLKIFDDKEFKKLLKAVINFTFRYSTICNLHNNILEARYSETAIGIRENKVKTTKEALKILEDIYPKDDIFISSFLTKSVTIGALARYILSSVDKANFKYSDPMGYDDFSLEHIIPKNPDKEWKVYFKKNNLKEEDVEELTYRIGNLTLLDIDMNRNAQNSFFDKKRDNYYKKSNLGITRPLKEEKEWNKETILKRQNWFAELANKVWEIDFS